MASEKNTACTLNVQQIEKNPILALGVNEKDIANYSRVAKAYGSVAPAIVGRREERYRVLSGQAKLEAYSHNRLKKIPVIVTEISSEAEEMKLALLLSTVREEGGALSEGAFINILTTQYGVPRKDLMKLLKKSKAWISKRQSLDTKLSGSVKDMVKSGAICARTAEEIAKLPLELQIKFASKVTTEGLSKTNAAHLVNLYRRDDTSDAMREIILNDPLSVLETNAGRSGTMRLAKRGIHERIAGNIRFIIRLAYELKDFLAKSDAETRELIRINLNELRTVLTDLGVFLEQTCVSPGKQGGEICD
jgi:ParB-like chromosome segregation protein Spo0J